MSTQLTDAITADTELLRVSDLVVDDLRDGRAIVKGVSFSVARGETLAIVGESGSGKSLSARALMGLLPRGLVASGSALLAGEDLLQLSPSRLRQVRGRGIGLLLQDPFTMLNPMITIGATLKETLLSNPDHGRAAKGKLEEDIDRRLSEVGITSRGVSKSFPWEMSGGMRQRIGIAAAIAKDPGLLIADEPTTALDATTQLEILKLIRAVQRGRGMGLVLITHDLRVALSMSDRILVMREGEVVEHSTPAALVGKAKSSYTHRLFAAELSLHERQSCLGGVPEEPTQTGTIHSNMAYAKLHDEVSGRGLPLSIRSLSKSFDRSPDTASATWALREVGLQVASGVSVGVIGESGSGKTTLVRCLLGLETPTAGRIQIGDTDITDRSLLSKSESKRVRSLIQCVFQDPFSSLNPSHKTGFTLSEAISLREGRTASRDAVASEVADLLAAVGLPAGVREVKPSALSGGQRQRVAIARALAMRPDVLICDEPVAALDLSVQAQVLSVLRDVQARGVRLLFITHDLPVVRQMTDEVAVLLRGKVVEYGPTAEVIDNPQHEYTQRLISAVPTGSSDWLESTAP